MKTIVFDLETIGNKSIVKHLPPVEPDSRLKNPEKIADNIKAKEIKQISELGLNPTTCQICIFGWHDGKESGHILLKEETKEAEQELLQEAWEILSEAERFVTFNGIDFDVPVLKFRSLANRIRPAIQISTRKYVIENHYDLRAILGNWNSYASGTLDYYSKILLGKSAKNDMDGSMVQDTWDMQLYEDLGKYAEEDCEVTFGIYQLLTKYYLL